jgi:hypothetical protein
MAKELSDHQCQVDVVAREIVSNKPIRTAKRTFDGGREASLEIVRPVSASGFELWV